MEKNGTLASPATALASRVLPVPGGPTSSAPLGILPPRAVYFLGFFRKSTISITSTLASSSPATSLNVTLFWLSPSNILACDLPTLNIPPPAPPPILRIGITNSIMKKTSISSIHIQSIMLAQPLVRSSITTSKRSSSGICCSTASNSVSALNVSETRK